MKELWIQFGTGKNKRFIPVHKLPYKLGRHMCSNLFKVHILTGSDTTSKIGAKAAAVKCGQIDYLNNFGLEYSINKSTVRKRRKILSCSFAKKFQTEKL